MRAAATQAQTTLLKDYNITISHSWCRALISTSIKTGIPVPTPQQTGGTLIPLGIEERIASVVRRVRSKKLPVFLDDVMAWATHLIQGTQYENNFEKGQASEGWYRGFLRRHNFLTGAERPLEMTRHECLTLGNLETYFHVCAEVLVKAGVANVNLNYDPNVKGSEPVLI